MAGYSNKKAGGTTAPAMTTAASPGCWNNYHIFGGMAQVDKPKIYFTHRELHMMGDSVAVCWNLHSEQVVKEIDGVRFTGKKMTRGAFPYIDFVDVRQDPQTGEMYEDEDSPGTGGFDPKYAAEIITELQRAIEYINTKGWEG